MSGLQIIRRHLRPVVQLLPHGVNADASDSVNITQFPQIPAQCAPGTIGKPPYVPQRYAGVSAVLRDARLRRGKPGVEIKGVKQPKLSFQL